MITLLTLAIAALATIGTIHTVRGMAAWLKRTESRLFGDTLRVTRPNRRRARAEESAETRVWSPSKTVTWDRLANERHAR